MTDPDQDQPRPVGEFKPAAGADPEERVAVAMEYIALQVGRIERRLAKIELEMRNAQQIMRASAPPKLSF